MGRTLGGFVLVLGLLGLVGCKPGAASLQRMIEKQSFCKLSDFQLTKEPESKSDGIYYDFAGTIHCSSQRGFYNYRFPTPTPIKGDAILITSWFGLFSELSRYRFQD
jgi:nitrous oxide reductase accessory protein NosL